MTKITFKDLPDTSTPLNASNLNTLQDNVENAISAAVSTVEGEIPTVDNSTSTSSTNPVENQAITNYVDTKGIYESGSNTNGSYIKYDDGTMICWYRQWFSAAIATQDGSLYKSADLALHDFPQTFYAIPIICMDYSMNNWQILSLGRGNTSSSTTVDSPGTAVLYRTTSTGTGTVGVAIHVIAIGRWKA